MAVDPVALLDAVKTATASESLGVAYEKALLACSDRERRVLSLLHAGSARSRAEACRMAGYTKASAAHELWGRLRVALAHRLHELLSDPARDVTRESYRDDLVALSHADPSDAFDDAGKLRPLSEWPKPLRRMVKRIKLGPFGQVEEVIFDGRASLMALLGKHKLVGAFDQVKVERRTYILRDYTGTSAPHLPAGAEGPPTTSPQAPAGAVPVLEAQVVASHPEIGDLDRGRIPVSGQSQRPAPASPAHGKR